MRQGLIYRLTPYAFLILAALFWLSSCTQTDPYCRHKRGGREFMSGNGFQEVLPLPDGKRFLAVFRKDLHQHLWLGKFRTDSGNTLSWRQLTWGARYDFDVAYNEKTDTFVFCSINGGYSANDKQTHIWKINADGTGLTQLTSGNSINHFPAISQDGTQVAFVSYATERQCDLWLYDIPNRRQTRLTNDTETHDTFPLFSADGQLFFLQGRRFGHNSPIASSDWKDFTVMRWNFEKQEAESLFDIKRDRQTEDFLITPDGGAMAIVDIQGETLIDDNVLFYRYKGVSPPELLEFQTEMYFLTFPNNHRITKAVVDLFFSLNGKQAVFIAQAQQNKPNNDNLHILDLESMQAHQLTHLDTNALPKEHYRLRKPVFFAGGQRFLFLVRLHGVDGTWNLWQCDSLGEHAAVLSTDPLMETAIIL